MREGLLVGQFITPTTMVPGDPSEVTRERATDAKVDGQV
jgi:hypothetical protein